MSKVPAGAGTALEVDQRLAQRLAGRVLPAVLGDEVAEALAAARCRDEPLSWRSPSPTTTDTLHAHQRADVAHDLAVGAHDLDMLPRRRRARPSPGARADPAPGT